MSSLVNMHLSRDNWKIWLARTQWKFSNGEGDRALPDILISSKLWMCTPSFQQLPGIAMLGRAAEKQEFGLWCEHRGYSQPRMEEPCLFLNWIVHAGWRWHSFSWGGTGNVRLGSAGSRAGINATCRSVSAAHTKWRLLFQVLQIPCMWPWKQQHVPVLGKSALLINQQPFQLVSGNLKTNFQPSFASRIK